MEISNKNKIIAIILAVVLICGTVLITTSLSAKADVILEVENPTLETKVYDGDTPGQQNYDATFVYSEADNKYSLQSNAWNMWNSYDDVAIAYENYKVKYGDKGIITVTATIEDFFPVDGVTPHITSSIGINIRSGDSANAANIFFHCRPQWVGSVVRSAKGSATYDAHSGEIEPVYPVQLKVVKQGNAISCSFKNANSDQWVNQPKVYVKMEEDLMVGLAIHSTNPKQEVKGIVKDFKVVIEGPEGSSYEGGETEDTESSEDLENIPLPDPEMTADMLLRETFTDGSLTEGTSAKDNIIWGEKGTDADYAVIETELDKNGNKNNVWHREFTTDYYYLGDDKWTDYSFSADFKYGDDCDPSAMNAFSMMVRTKVAEFTGYYNYTVRIEYGKRIVIYKKVNEPAADPGGVEIARVDLEKSLLDIKWHNIKVDAFDNVITVYIDGTNVLSVTDDYINVQTPYADLPMKIINTIGGVGIGSVGTDLYLDNLIVRELLDPKGGDWDNSIDGNWDKDIPDYITNWNN